MNNSITLSRAALLPVLGSLCFSLPALAEKAHVHGEAELQVAIEGGQVEIEFESPLANLVGFEHAPSDAAQHKQLDEAVALLSDAKNLLGLPEGAQCVLASAEVHSPFEDEHDHEEEEHKEHDDDHKKHDEDEHDDDHKKHDEDEHHDEHADHDDDTHSDMQVHYVFRCEQADQLGWLDMSGLFTAFSGIEELHAEWLTDNGQSSAELTSAKARIELR